VETKNTLAGGDIALVAASEITNLLERIRLSRGSQGASGRVGCQHYVDNAFIPMGDWRFPSEEELHLLTQPRLVESKRLEDWVQILKFEDAIIDLFAPLQRIVERYQSVHAARRFALGEAMLDAVNTVGETVMTRFPSAKPIKTLGINIVEPGLHTGSLQIPTVRRYVGLHVDQWRENDPLSDKAARLCINVGAKPRYFLYMNYSVEAMRRRLRTDEHDESVVARQFLLQHVECPVVRLELLPGEAYLALTGNMIHDATTLPMRKFDLSVSFLGGFLHHHPPSPI
jgi:hypothetical protein